MRSSEIVNGFQNYSLKLYSSDICSFSEAFTFPQSENQRLWIIISGNGIYFNSTDNDPKKYKKHCFISKNCSDEWIFTPANSQTSVFYAEYKLFVSSSATADSSGNGFQMNFHICEHEFEYETKQAADYLPDADAYIQAILKIFRNEIPKEVLLAKRIEYVVTSAIEFECANRLMVFHYVSAVAIECLEPIKHPDLTLDFSNIKIKFEKEHDVTETIMTFYTNHKYIELPKQTYNYVYEYYTDIIKNRFCRFTVKSKDLFKIWFFRGPKTDGSSITDILKNGYISFSVKSNKSCRLQLSLYSIPSYNSIPYYFEVKKTDKFNEYRIPLLTNQKSATKSPYVMQALKYIQDNFREKITVDEIANHILINPTYLSRLFHREVGQPITSYINFCRINLAKQLLFESNGTITSIAAQTGFYDSSHFLKAFKKAVGMTPKEYRHIEKKKK